jgi:outer membrane protein assembly factor BamB
MTLVSLGALAAGCGGAGGDDGSTNAVARSDPPPAKATPAATSAQDWPMFGRSPSRPNSSSASIGIGPDEVAKLQRQRVALPGTVDSAPIFLHAVRVGGARRDVFVMTTTYGRTVAVAAATGRLLWTFTPRGYRTWAGSYRLTTASPVASGDRRFVYAGASDGRVHKLTLGAGHEIRAGRWPVTITRLPIREKVTPSFMMARGRLVVATGGFIGDAPPYQGHVVTIDPRSGRVIGVFNALCANRHSIIAPSTCSQSGSAIWARGAVAATPDGSLLVTTGDGHFDGRRDFGDSVIRISATARRVLGSWTPVNQASLDAGDVDLGSTGPRVIGGGSVLQSGKDARLHVFAYSSLRRRGSVGRERQTLPAPGRTAMFTDPAVWRSGGRTFVFVTTGGGTAAYEQRGGRLQHLWNNGVAGTTPMVAGGLLYIHDPETGTLVVYRPVTGARLARLPAGPGHWGSPVPGAGVIALPQGDGNQHQTSGTLNLYRAP